MTDKQNDDKWKDSYDAPCFVCKGTPCYTLLDGEPVCDKCVKQMRGG